jgi:murein DD-endopeptidase MepM/ murein hydrolase activator NlpD
MHRVFKIVVVSLSMAVTMSVSAADVGFHVVAAKGQNLIQTNAVGPLIPSTNDPPFEFLSFVQPTGPGTVTNVTLKPPGGSTFTLSYSPDDGRYRTNAGFADKASLDAAFSAGIYTQRIYAVTDGTRSVALGLPGDAYPTNPIIVNWSAAQSVDMTRPFTLQWASFTGGTSNDYILLEAEDINASTVINSGPPGQPGSLNGTNTSYFIPAGVLQPGSNYHAWIMFAKMTAVTNAFPGATGVTAYLKNNSFTIIATPQPNLLFFDGFQQFHAGDNLTTTSSTPIVGSSAFFEIETGSPTVTATNIQGSIWASLNCAPGSDVLSYCCVPSRTVSNETVNIEWLMCINNTNAGFGGISADITTTNALFDGPWQPIVFFTDSGAVVAFTNTPSPESAVPIGIWGTKVGTVMTNQLVINYQTRTFSFSLNGTVLTSNMTLSAFYAHYLDQLRITGYEAWTGPTFFGNQFRFDNIKITVTPPPLPPDVTGYMVAKGLQFIQTNSSASVPASDTPVMSDLEVQKSSSGSVVSASVQLPGGGSRTLYESPWENIFQTNEWFATTNALNATYQNGTYNFIINGVNDGISTASVSLSSSPYPNAPHVSNWTTAQSIVATNAFTLIWDAFSGGTTNDFIQVTIENPGGYSLFWTPNVGMPGALNGTNTSITIPAYTLTPGITYDVRLTFARPVSINTTGYPGAIGSAAYFSMTETTIATTNPNADSVGDGIPDWWRALYFGGDGKTTNNLSAAFADPDGDGRNNLQEYWTSTVPTNSASFLRVSSAAREGSDMRVGWFVANGKTYILQTSTNLVADSFTNTANQVAAITILPAPPITLTNYLHSGGATNVRSRFYRVACPVGFILITPYVNESDMNNVPEAYSSTTNCPWGFVHNGIDFIPNGPLMPYRAAAAGVVQWVYLFQNPSALTWQVNVAIACDSTNMIEYCFEPMSLLEADGQAQLSNIVVTVGQTVAQGEVIGYLHTTVAWSLVHLGLKQNGSWVCPEPFFAEPARQSILNLLRVAHPGAALCY